MSNELIQPTAIRQRLQSLAERMMQKARDKGADEAEISAGISQSLCAGARAGEAERLEFVIEQSLTLRLYKQQRKGVASINTLDEQAIDRALDMALAMAEQASPDACNGLPEQAELASETRDFDLWHPWDLDSHGAMHLALACEQAALDYDPRIEQTEGADLESRLGLGLYANSLGFVGFSKHSRHGMSVMPIARSTTGDRQRDYDWDSRCRADLLKSPESLGRAAAACTLARLDPGKPPTGHAPVLFTERVSGSLAGHLLSAISGASLYKDMSWLKDKLGCRVLPEGFQLVERPHLTGSLSSTDYDSKGMPTRTQSFVVDGILEQYVLDLYSARKLGLSPTGNSSGVHNLFFESPDPRPFESLVREMERGLIVTDLMGSAINPVTGDYSRGASGFWVEQGQIRFPVAEVTIAGRLQEMLAGIVATGNDPDDRKNIRCGALLVERMMVGGQ
jgi:PmbA protein